MPDVIGGTPYGIDFHGRAADQKFVNSLWYVYRDDEADANNENHQIGAAADAIFDHVWDDAAVPQELSAEYVLEKYIMRLVASVDSDPGPPVTYKVNYTDGYEGIPDPLPSGAQLGACMPTYVSATARKKTATYGKSSRGSIRFGPIVEADTKADSNFNQLEQARLDSWEITLQLLEASVALPGTLVNSRMVPIVFSRKIASIEVGPFPGAQFPITELQMNRFVGSQLSRKKKNAAL